MLQRGFRRGHGGTTVIGLQADLDPGKMRVLVVRAGSQHLVAERGGLGHCARRAVQTDGEAAVARRQLRLGHRPHQLQRPGRVSGSLQRLGRFSAQQSLPRHQAHRVASERNGRHGIAARPRDLDQPDPGPEVVGVLGDDPAEPALRQCRLARLGQPARHSEAQRGQPARIALRPVQPVRQIAKQPRHVTRPGLVIPSRIHARSLPEGACSTGL